MQIGSNDSNPSKLMKLMNYLEI